MPLYFIAILTPPKITGQVRSIQKEFEKNYDSKRQLKIPVHLTLVPPFKRDADFEKTMIPSLQDFAEEQQPFEIDLQDFGAFGERVIFVNVRKNDRLKKLHRDLISWLSAKLYFEDLETGKRFHPHVTLANRDLKPEAFKKAWPEFKKRTFSASFHATSIYLLKHNSLVWEIFHEFQFGRVV